MEKKGNFLRRNSAQERMLDEFSYANRLPMWGFFVLIALFIAGSVFVRFTATSNGAFMISHQPVPHRTITGAFSAICNICILSMVVLYKKPGFIFSVVVLTAQFPSLIIQFLNHNYTSISGIFSTAFIIIASCIVYTFVHRATLYQMRMRDQAVTDRLTGISNRFATGELMKYLIQKKEHFAFVVIKFNNFNDINNTLGQQAGDKALVQIADRLTKIVESESTGTKDFIATRKGNDFLLVIRDFESEENIRDTIDIYAQALTEKFIVEDVDFVLSTSIGYSVYPTDATEDQTIFDYAYVAMTQAKKSGYPGTICRFSKKLLDNDHSVEIERTIRHALDNDGVFYNLQPQFDMNHKLRGFEALARIRDEQGDVVSPVVFIPVAEKTGLVDKIDQKVLFDASKFMGEVVRKTHSNVVLSVNASVRHLLRSGFVDEIKAALKESGLPANQLEIEITESILIESVEKAIKCIKQISALGVRIAIDDFGTGYSSLSYLNSFPADLIKVDRSFIITMNSSETSKQFVAAIIALGHVMNYKVIAEGVENQEQLDTLNQIGCDLIQGFVWGRPMDPEEAAKLIGK